MLEVSVVIVNYNSKDVLSQCLNSIYKNSQGVSWEILVVDNGSSDSSSSTLKEKFPNVRLIQNPSNLGFVRAVNQGLKQAKGKYLLCLNNDTIVLEGCLNNLVKFMDGNPSAAVVGGQVLDSERKIEFSCRSFPQFYTCLFNRYSLLTKMFPNNLYSRKYLMSDWSHNEIREVDWVSAAFLAMRRKTIDDIGLLDEDYFIYCEDVDYCFRALKKGLKVYYLPEAKVIHFNASGGSQLLPFKMIIERHKSIYRFYKKFYWSNYPKIFNLLVAGGIVLRAVIFLMMRSIKKIFKPS